MVAAVQVFVEHLDCRMTEHGAVLRRCLPKNWRHIVFNMLVSIADDHLRNHALEHFGKPMVYKSDLQDFFPKITIRVTQECQCPLIQTV